MAFVLDFYFNHGAVTLSYHILFWQGALPGTRLPLVFVCQMPIKPMFVLYDMSMLMK